MWNTGDILDHIHDGEDRYINSDMDVDSRPEEERKRVQDIGFNIASTNEKDNIDIQVDIVEDANSEKVRSLSGIKVFSSEYLSIIQKTQNEIYDSDDEDKLKYVHKDKVQNKVKAVCKRPRIRSVPDVELQHLVKVEKIVNNNDICDPFVFKPYVKNSEFLTTFERKVKVLTLEEKSFFGKVCWGGFQDYWYN
jgi:hypothetical protein